MGREGQFLGADVVRDQLENGVSRKRIGLEVTKGAPARNGMEILSESGDVIGNITSGTFSPNIKKAIAMGYVKPEFSKPGTSIQVKVRKRLSNAKVVKMPFVPKGTTA